MKKYSKNAVEKTVIYSKNATCNIRKKSGKYGRLYKEIRRNIFSLYYIASTYVSKRYISSARSAKTNRGLAGRSKQESLGAKISVRFSKSSRNATLSWQPAAPWVPAAAFLRSHIKKHLYGKMMKKEKCLQFSLR